VVNHISAERAAIGNPSSYTDFHHNSWVVQSTVNLGKTELMQGKRTNIELKEERSPWQESLIANGEIMQASLRLHVKI
jgi:hypothetical protein